MIWKGIVAVGPDIYRVLLPSALASGRAVGAPRSGGGASTGPLSMLKIVLRDIHAIDDIAIYVDCDDVPFVLLQVSARALSKFRLLSDLNLRQVGFCAHRAYFLGSL